MSCLSRTKPVTRPADIFANHRTPIMSGPRIAWGFLKAFILFNCGAMLFGIYLMEYSPPFWGAHWKWAWAPALVAYVYVVTHVCWLIRCENGPEWPLLTASGAVFMSVSFLAAVLGVRTCLDRGGPRVRHASQSRGGGGLPPVPAVGLVAVMGADRLT